MELPEIVKLEVVKLEPGDTIAATIRRGMSQESMARIGEQLKDRFPEQTILVLEEGNIKLEVFRK